MNHVFRATHAAAVRLNPAHVDPAARCLLVETDRRLTIDQVAAAAGVNRATLFRWRFHEECPSERERGGGRTMLYKLSDVADWFAKRGVIANA